jgi:hypothetical protein
MPDKSRNTKQSPTEFKKGLDAYSKEQSNMAIDYLGRKWKSRNKSTKKTEYDPVATSTEKTTEKSLESLTSLVSKMMGNMSYAAKAISSDFGKDITSKYMNAAGNWMTKKSISHEDPMKRAEMNVLATKLITSSLQSISESGAKNWTEFTRWNDEFSSMGSLAESIANDFRHAGHEVTAATPFVRKLTNDVMNLAKGAMEIDKATGETKLAGMVATMKKLEEKQEQWNKVASALPEWYQKIKSAVTSTGAALAASAVVLITKFTEFAENINETRKQLGLSVTQTVQLTGTITKAGFQSRMWAGSSKDLNESYQAIVKYSGNINMATAEAVTNVDKMVVLTRISAEEAAELQRGFLLVGKGSQSTANYLTNSAINMARMNGLGSEKMMSELAKNTNLFAGGTLESTKNMITGVAMAAKLNVEFSKLMRC